MEQVENNVEVAVPTNEKVRKDNGWRIALSVCSVVIIVILICFVVALIIKVSSDNGTEPVEEVTNESVILIDEIKKLDSECEYSCRKQILEKVNELIEMPESYETVVAICNYGGKFSRDDVYLKYCDKAEVMWDDNHKPDVTNFLVIGGDDEE